MATNDPNHDTGSHHIRSTIQAAAVLLGINIAMFLVVTGIVYVHVLTSHDASAAIAPASSVVPPAAATASRPPLGEPESPPSDSLEQVLKRTDSSRECGPSAGIDSDCIYN